MSEVEPSPEELDKQLESLAEWRFMRFVEAHAITEVDPETMGGEVGKQSEYRLDLSDSAVPVDGVTFYVYRHNQDPEFDTLGYEYGIALLRRGVTVYELLYIEDRFDHAANEEEYRWFRGRTYMELVTGRLNAVPGYFPNVGGFHEYLPDQGLEELNSDEALQAVNGVMNKLTDLEAQGLLTPITE